MADKTHELIDKLIINSKNLSSFEQMIRQLGDRRDNNGIRLSESAKYYSKKVNDLKLEILTRIEKLEK